MSLQPPILFAATASEIALTMLFLIAVLITLRVLTAVQNRDEEDYVEITYECESCGEVLQADLQPCPVCGGRIQRGETRPD